MMRINAEIRGQPIEIATGPPLFHACANVVKHPAKIEIIENEIAKFENELLQRIIKLDSEINLDQISNLKFLQ